MKLLLVTGTYNDTEGKPSHFGNKIRESAEKHKFNVMHYNGGHLTDFNAIMNDLHTYGAIIWMPNLDNKIEKMLPVIKNVASKTLLVSSKRVIEKDYGEFEIVGRLLKTRSNLGIMITKEEDDYGFTVLDPLANRWSHKVSIEEASDFLFERIINVLKYKRISSESIGPKRKIEMDQKFLTIVKDYGELFDELIRAVYPERFLGNASTRCMHGFPSTRSEDGTILMSKRNIDKTIINSQGFVEVKSEESIVKYFGDLKPSVDTPVQIKLFNYYQNVNYIVHGHVYVKDTMITSKNIPCGFIEEFDEVTRWFPDKKASNFAVNLKGHGCLLLAKDLNWLEETKSRLVARPFPEDCQW